MGTLESGGVRPIQLKRWKILGAAKAAEPVSAQAQASVGSLREVAARNVQVGDCINPASLVVPPFRSLFGSAKREGR